MISGIKMALFCDHQYEETHRKDSSWYNAIFITYVCKKCLKKKVVKIEK